MNIDSQRDLQRDDSPAQRDMLVGNPESAVMTVIEERLDIGKRVVESGGAVRLRKVVHEEVVAVDEPLTSEVIEVERVAVDRPVDAEVPVRHEGEVTIFPVLEERLVTRKQLVLVEEIRVTRRSRARSAPQETTLRREEVIAERLDPASGEWRPIDRA